MTETEIAIKTYPELETGTETETVMEADIMTERLSDTPACIETETGTETETETDRDRGSDIAETATCIETRSVTE